MRALGAGGTRVAKVARSLGALGAGGTRVASSLLEIKGLRFLWFLGLDLRNVS